MGLKRMGYEGQIFHGVAGATGATQITNATDLAYNFDTEKGNTTVRGTGALSPIQTERVTRRIASIEFTMLDDETDTSLTALKTAAYAGTPIAIRTKQYSSGKGYDGDCVLTINQGMPLSGEQTVVITGVPTDESGRAPLVWV